MVFTPSKTLEERKKIILEHEVIFPKNIPMLIQHQPEGEAEYNIGYKQGWMDYLEKAKKAFTEITDYKQIIPLANTPQPTAATYKNIHYSVGYTMGWQNFRFFMKKVFFQ